MTTLDFTDSEPPIKTTKAAQANALTGSAAFYDRLQGRQKKGIERYGWVALPIAAVAILGVVAATSTPHSSADDVVGAPGQTTTAAATSAPSVKIAQASTDDVTPASVQSPSAIRAKIDAAPTAVQAPSSAPAPVKVAKRAPAPRSDAVTTAPAAATPVTRTAPAPAPAAVNPPAAIVAPPVAAPVDSPAPAVSAAPAAEAPSVTEAPAQSAPAETAPAQ
jgi:hypothetical protein